MMWNVCKYVYISILLPAEGGMLIMCSSVNIATNSASADNVYYVYL